MTAYLEPAAPKRTKSTKSKSIPDEENMPLETKRRSPPVGRLSGYSKKSIISYKQFHEI
jgi:hypothetical protein